jgi:RNA polymerase sigma-70 factor (ECF subfamily)
LYWYPLYSFVRRKGLSPIDAEDLTQAFFEHLLEKKTISRADQERGRFRTFLLTAMTNFLSNHWRREARRNRTTENRIASLNLNFEEGEQKYQAEPFHEISAERVFDRSWAMTLLQDAFSELSRSYADAGRGDLFQALSPYLSGEDPPSYRELAEQLDTTEGALKVAMHRMRGKAKSILRRRVSDTVESQDQIDDEIRDLFAIFAN